MGNITHFDSTWGLHLFKSQIYPGLESGSYFLERPYASFMVFPPQEHSMDLAPQGKDLEFLEKKGGVAFLLQLYQDRPNAIQRRLYDRFGSPMICPWEEPYFSTLVHEDYSFRYGKVDEDFYDHHVSFTKVKALGENEHWELPLLIINQRQVAFLVLGAPILYDRGLVRHAPTGLAIKQFALPRGHIASKVSEIYLIFQFFRGLNWMSAKGMIS